MRKTVNMLLCKWALLGLFVSYMACSMFFTHTHVINRVVYVHSHPFKKGEPKQHSHTAKELYALDCLCHAPIEPDVVPCFRFEALSQPVEVVKAELLQTILPAILPGNNLLRAPPL